MLPANYTSNVDPGVKNGFEAETLDILCLGFLVFFLINKHKYDIE